VTPLRVAIVVAAVAGVLHLGSLSLGFALDDDLILHQNPRVTEGHLGAAVASPYWQMEPEWGTLWRPVTIGSFVLEWELWDGSPAGFHAVNVATHATVAGGVALLLAHLLPGLFALLGGLFFAVHPVHVEAVANVAGRAELYAALPFVAACLLFMWHPGRTGARVSRLLGIAAAYALALGAKEIGVTLPAVLLLLAVHPATRKEEDRGPQRAIWHDLPLFLLLGGVLATYVVLRWSVLGSLMGETLPAELVGLSGDERLLTALTLWPEYLRLFVVPVDLVADYGPAVLMPVGSVTPSVVLGAGVLCAAIAGAWLLRERRPVISLGLAWFLVTILPVAHLGVHAGVLLAERILYLPSVGWALVAGGVATFAWERVEAARAGEGVPAVSGGARAPVALGAVAALLLAALAVRSWTRVPVWDSTFTLMSELADDHPESHRALRLYGDLLKREGDLAGATEAFDRAAELHPHRYPVLLEAGGIHREAGNLATAAEYFARAVERAPDRRTAYRLLTELELRRNRGREAHRVALAGLAAAGPDAELWARVADSYLLRGDLAAAERAQRAAVGREPDDPARWARLAEIREARGDWLGAEDARLRASEVGG